MGKLLSTAKHPVSSRPFWTCFSQKCSPEPCGNRPHKRKVHRGLTVPVANLDAIAARQRLSEVRVDVCPRIVCEIIDTPFSSRLARRFSGFLRRHGQICSATGEWSKHTGQQ